MLLQDAARYLDLHDRHMFDILARKAMERQAEEARQRLAHVAAGLSPMVFRQNGHTDRLVPWYAVPPRTLDARGPTDGIGRIAFER